MPNPLSKWIPEKAKREVEKLAAKAAEKAAANPITVEPEAPAPVIEPPTDIKVREIEAKLAAAQEVLLSRILRRGPHLV